MEINKRLITGLGSFLILCTICAAYALFTAQAQTSKECTVCPVESGRDAQMIGIDRVTLTPTLTRTQPRLRLTVRNV